MLERRGILSDHRNGDIELHCDLQEHFNTTSILVPPLNGWDILDMVWNTNQSINQSINQSTRFTHDSFQEKILNQDVNP